MLSFQDFAEQGSFVERLQHRIQENTFPHALLILGEPGSGKKTLTELLAAALLCRSASARPCGECAACRLSYSGTHPDLLVIRKGASISAQKDEKAKTVIPVSEIEELETRCATLPFEGNNRVTIILRAEDMNSAAQNKLLKTLEEPAPGNYFLLTCEKREMLLPTIISRCESVFLHPWSRDKLLSVLKMRGVPEDRAENASEEAKGSIGVALQLAEDESFWELRQEIYETFFHLKKAGDILSVSNRWKDRKADAELLFSQLESGFVHLLNYRLYGAKAGEEDRLRQMFDSSWLHFAGECELEAFSRLMDGMLLARKRFRASVNFQIIIEQILFMMMEENRQWLM